MSNETTTPPPTARADSPALTGSATVVSQSERYVVQACYRKEHRWYDLYICADRAEAITTAQVERRADTAETHKYRVTKRTRRDELVESQSVKVSDGSGQ